MRYYPHCGLESCGCQVIVQSLHAKITGGRVRLRNNAGISATALRVGNSTFVISGNGTLRITTPEHSEVLLAERRSWSALYSCCVVSRVAVQTAGAQATRGLDGRYNGHYAWKIDLPGGGGSYTLITYRAFMPQGYQYGTWLTIPDTIRLMDTGGICSGKCARGHVPFLPSAQ